MIRRKSRKGRINLVDPFAGIGQLAEQGEQAVGSKLASVSKSVDDIHRALLDTQAKINELWNSAKKLASPAPANTAASNADQAGAAATQPAATGTGTSAAAFPGIEELALHEKAMTEEKLNAIAAHMNSIHTALAETQNKLSSMWSATESKVANLQAANAATRSAAAAAAAGNPGAQATPATGTPATTAATSTAPTSKLPLPVSGQAVAASASSSSASDK